MKFQSRFSPAPHTFRHGFTLIELLMVVAIIATLAVIAIPALNGYRSRANNSAALTDLKNFKTSMEAYYADNQGYPSF